MGDICYMSDIFRNLQIARHLQIEESVIHMQRIYVKHLMRGIMLYARHLLYAGHLLYILTSSQTLESNQRTTILLFCFVFRSESFKRFGLKFYAYMCLDLQQVTTVSTGDLFIYYKASGKHINALKSNISSFEN